jgi:hypothetical protein
MPIGQIVGRMTAAATHHPRMEFVLSLVVIAAMVFMERHPR